MSTDPSRFSGPARFAEDTRRRFLAEILARVPVERLVEVHLFTPIRQGGVETGVAVVAAAQDARTIEPVAAGEAAPDETPPPTPAEAIADAPSDAPQADPTEAAADADVTEATSVVEPAEAGVADAPAAPAPPPDEPVALDADAPLAVEGLAVEDLAEVLAEEVAGDAEPEDAPPPPRLTVFTARYRLAIKGPDRGKWDADVVAEAEAPLVTVEAVVRGVQRRAGDAAGPERLGADAVARIVSGTHGA